MKRKRNKFVLFPIDEFKICGVMSFIQQYSKILSDHGYSVIIVGWKSDLKDPKIFFEKSEIVFVPGKIEYGWFGRMVTFWKYVKTLDAIYKDFDVEVIHFSTMWSTLFSFMHYKTFSKKRIITFYGAYFLERLSINSTFKLGFLLKKLQQLTLLSSSKIVTFSTYAEQLIVNNFSKKYQNKIVVIPGLVTMPNSKPKLLSETRQKRIRILNFGRAERRKGIPLLIEAVTLLRKKGFNVTLELASPVEYFIWFSEIMDLYESNNLFLSLHLLHKVNEPQKKKLILNTDIFVIPSTSLETFGMTIIENFKYGGIVIGTPVGAIPEILTKVDNRLISKKISADSLAETIENYWQLPISEKRKIQKKAIEVVKSEYLLETHTQDILDLYSF